MHNNKLNTKNQVKRELKMPDNEFFNTKGINDYLLESIAEYYEFRKTHKQNRTLKTKLRRN